MAAAVAKLRRSESAKEEEEKKKVKTDVIKPSKPPSMFGSFSSKVSSNLQSVGRKLSGSVTAMSQKLRNNETEYREIMATKEEEDDEFRRILLWTKRDLDNSKFRICRQPPKIIFSLSLTPTKLSKSRICLIIRPCSISCTQQYAGSHFKG